MRLERLAASHEHAPGCADVLAGVGIKADPVLLVATIALVNESAFSPVKPR